MKKTKFQLITIIGFLFFFCNSSFSFFFQTKELQENNLSSNDTISILQHFKSIGDVLEVTLEADLEEFIEKKYTGDYHPAKFTYLNAEGDSIKYKVKIKSRGRFRRQLCVIPPMKFKFKKKHLKKNGFKKHNTYKFVNICKKGNYGEKLILREYLAYELFNQLTEASYQVQLVKIKYIDTSGKRKTQERFGFFIENDDELAERLEGEICDCRGNNVKDLQPIPYQKIALYNYMIGNTDWRIEFLHNIRLVQQRDSSKLLAVPYDFDFSGLVDADYARPSPDFDIQNVRERHYRGFRFDNPNFLPVQDLFIGKEQKIFQTISEIEALDKHSRRWVEKYLKGFYKILKSEKKRARKFKPQRMSRK